ncbi:conserved uncharacterized protein [Erwinia pyrifoliae Ep1/96]|nr:conserved uncharacterized protein [Erwinia pyrifoliae Ep1/96]
MNRDYSIGRMPINWPDGMKNDFFCVPVHTLHGELIAIDCCYRPPGAASYGGALVGQSFISAQDLLLNQLLFIEQQAEFFRQHGLLCSLTIDFQQARAVVESTFIQQILSHLPFIRLKLSEHFPNLHDGMNNPLLRTLVEQLNILWLDDLGSGCANLHALQSNMFEAVKLERCFYRENVCKPWFSVLIKHIRRYANRVIVEGVADDEQLQTLYSSDIWAVQGYFMPMMAFDHLRYAIAARGDGG